MRLRVFHRYMIQDFLTIFGLTLMVFTFVMCLGALVKAIDLLAKGVPIGIIGSVFLYNMPYVLSFSIPMSCLTGTLLLFGRLSIDGEITAMRASGMSIWQISSPVLLMSVLLSLLCVYVNYDTAPRSHYARRVSMLQAGEMNPLDMLEEQKYNKEFPGLQIYIGRIDGDKIYDVSINELDGNSIKRTIRAREGITSQNVETKVLDITLMEVRIEQPDPNYPNDPSKTLHFPANTWTYSLNLKERLGVDKKVRKNRKDMTFPEITKTIRNIREIYPDYPAEYLIKRRQKLVIEANKRLTLAMSCFSFALIGIPLGMKSKRKESSVGIGMSLGLVVVFYFFVIIAESLAGSPQFMPDLIIWIPVFVAQILGFVLLKRIQ